MSAVLARWIVKFVSLVYETGQEKIISYFFIFLFMSKKLFVGNLPWSVSTEELQALFEKFGVIEDVIVIRDKMTNRSKGFGFVTFTEEPDADAAITEMNEHDVDGRQIVVNEAKPPKY